MTVTSSTSSPHTHSHHPAGPRTGLWVVLAAFAILVVAGVLWMEGVFTPKPRVALVTASPTGKYWELIVEGARDAARRHDVRLDVIRPAAGEAAQSKAINDLVGAGYDGVAVSPNDSVRQARTLGEVAEKSNLVTFDSDSAISRRLCFVGTDNYDAGLMCGQNVRDAMPGGGTVIIAIGSVEKENGQRRRQGLVDSLLERTFEPMRPMDPVDGTLKGPKYTIISTLVDNYDPQHATDLAAEAIKAHPDLGCFVGLFASNTPAILKAMQQTNTLGKIKVVGFDAAEETLDGIAKGWVYSAIVQDAYNMGYQAVRILADAAHGEANAVPLFPTLYLKCDEVNQNNLEEMKKAMAQRNKPGAVARPPSTQASAPRGAAEPTTRPSETKAETKAETKSEAK
jgi:ribose transport system substrate-binding protein